MSALCVQKELSSANVDSSIHHDTLVKKSEVSLLDTLQTILLAEVVTYCLNYIKIHVLFLHWLASWVT